MEKVKRQGDIFAVFFRTSRIIARSARLMKGK